MEQTLITTHPDYFLLVDEEAEVEMNKYFYSYKENKVFLAGNNPDNIFRFLVIAHRPKANQPLLEGVPVLPDLPKVEEDEAMLLLKQLKNLLTKEHGYHANSNHVVHIDRVLAKPSEKRFSEAIELLKECAEEYSDHSLKNRLDAFLHSLTTPQQPKGFIVEYETCLQALPKDRFTPKIINNTICGKWVF